MRQSSFTYLKITFCLLILVFSGYGLAHAQQTWIRDFNNMMEIPSTQTMESSATHLYVLSEDEGLVVFRTREDALQWLYSSEGMERRGDRLQGDVRFAYLYGDDRRLTIVEPTSVLGVYSSTTLPAVPQSIQRMANHIYIALGSDGLVRLSLESPEQVDQAPEQLFNDLLQDREVLDLVSDGISRLYLLTSHQELMVFDLAEGGDQLEHTRTVELDRDVHRLFLTQEELIASDRDGGLYYIGSSGNTDQIADVQEPVRKLHFWKERVVVNTESGHIWIGVPGQELLPWKDDPESRETFALVKDRLWISEGDRVYPVQASQTLSQEERSEGPLEVKPVEDITIPFPRPVIIPLELVSNHTLDEVEFSYSSSIQNASIRGQSLYWQPSSSQTGLHLFTVTASTPDGETDQISFQVNVRPFNSPPRFTPVPEISINVQEEFQLDVQAIDPDGTDPDLIRYIGIDLPDGAILDERTGAFIWTPSLRQVGSTEFQVIATDQYGSAASMDIRIQVIETDREQEADLDIIDI